MALHSRRNQRVLRRLDPMVPIVVASGHSFADFPTTDANTRTLGKPITREELRQCLEMLVPTSQGDAHGASQSLKDFV